MKVYVGTRRRVGELCREWARQFGNIVDSPEECDVFISVLYDKILDESFIRSKVKCYNFHPGLLPEYGGSGTCSWVLINGEEKTGVTLHEIDKDIDHGPIIKKWEFSIEEDDTAETLFNKSEEIIFTQFTKLYDSLSKGELSGTPQETTMVYYRSDLERAKDLTKYVRAFTFTGKERPYYYKKGLKIYL